MKRFSVLTKDNTISQEDSQIPLPNKKLCTQNSSVSSFSTNSQPFATVSATQQYQQNSSRPYQTSGDFFQQFMASQLPVTRMSDENHINRDFLGLEKNDGQLAIQNSIFNNYDDLQQAQFTLNKNVPTLFPNNLIGVSNPNLGMDFNMNNLVPLPTNNSAQSLLKILQTQSNLQGQNLNLQLNQQNNLFFLKTRQMMEALNNRKRDSSEAFGDNIDKLQGHLKKEEEEYDQQAFADEMELRISELIYSQNKMLTDFKEKNRMIEGSLKAALDEIKGLNQVIKHRNLSSPIDDSANPLRMHQVINNSNDMASIDILVSHLCGANTDFEYQLILKSELQLPLYRERNFKFTVLLTDKKGNVIQDIEEFPLTLSIYNSENPPKSIESNNSGNKVLKGVNVKSMTNGVANFEKIQIKEVTSHLRNGWIFLVVQPMSIQNEKTNSKSMSSNRGKYSVDIKKIKPLVIDKIVVKAKKLKEKDISEENEDS